MKLTNNTIDVLKNFASINKTIKIEANTPEILTGSPGSVYARAGIDESFPVEVRFFEVGNFLSVLSLFEKPNLEFEEKYVEIIGEGKNRIRFFFADPNIKIDRAPFELNSISNPYITCSLTTDQLKELNSAARVLHAQHIVVRGEDGDLTINAMSANVPNSNKYSLSLGKTNKTFQFSYIESSFLMLLGDYDFNFNEKGSLYLSCKDRKLEYWLGKIPSLSFTG